MTLPSNADAAQSANARALAHHEDEDCKDPNGFALMEFEPAIILLVYGARNIHQLEMGNAEL